MVKRSREASHLLARQQLKQENPNKSPSSKRRREPSVGGVGTGEPSGPMEKGPPEPEANGIAGDLLRPHVVAGAPGAQATWDVGTAAAELPRWWQLWLGRGGGPVVNCEELLWGWFPFVDEDFSPDSEKVGCFSIWQQEDVLFNDIWQLKHLNEIPSRSR